jgi:hypothetical protein
MIQELKDTPDTMIGFVARDEVTKEAKHIFQKAH